MVIYFYNSLVYTCSGNNKMYYILSDITIISDTADAARYICMYGY